MDSNDTLAEARNVVEEQARDERLWFQPVHITEDTLQKALRRLHAAIEGISPDDAARAFLKMWVLDNAKGQVKAASRTGQIASAALKQDEVTPTNLTPQEAVKRRIWRENAESDRAALKPGDEK